MRDARQQQAAPAPPDINLQDVEHGRHAPPHGQVPSSTYAGGQLDKRRAWEDGVNTPAMNRPRSGQPPAQESGNDASPTMWEKLAVTLNVRAFARNDEENQKLASTAPASLGRTHASARGGQPNNTWSQWMMDFAEEWFSPGQFEAATVKVKIPINIPGTEGSGKRMTKLVPVKLKVPGCTVGCRDLKERVKKMKDVQRALNSDPYGKILVDRFGTLANDVPQQFMDFVEGTTNQVGDFLPSVLNTLTGNHKIHREDIDLQASHDVDLDTLKDRDNCVDVDKLIEVDLEEADPLSFYITPYFVFAQCAIALFLWLLGIARETNGVTWYAAQGGLDTFFPDKTTLQPHTKDCDDLRPEVWRLLTYQFTHNGIQHVGMNAILLFVVGPQLEKFQGALGWWRMPLMFNVGVLGGACFAIVWETHGTVVGMSGGVYSLFGVHFAELFMNWGPHKPFRWAKLFMLLMIAAYEIGSAWLFTSEENISYAAHLGGTVFGFCIGIVIGRNINVKRWERILQFFFCIVGVAVLVFCLSWGLYWKPPKALWETTGWCWSRQVSNNLCFGDANWHCIRGGNKASLAQWKLPADNMKTVSTRVCEKIGWSVVGETLLRTCTSPHP